MVDDYYKLLCVEKNSSNEEIKKSFRKLSLKYHPDRNNNSESSNKKFREINEAYEVLSNNDKRREYDDMLRCNDEFYYNERNVDDNILNKLNNIYFGSMSRDGRSMMGCDRSSCEMSDIYSNDSHSSSFTSPFVRPKSFISFMSELKNMPLRRVNSVNKHFFPNDQSDNQYDNILSGGNGINIVHMSNAPDMCLDGGVSFMNVLEELRKLGGFSLDNLDNMSSFIDMRRVKVDDMGSGMGCGMGDGMGVMNKKKSGLENVKLHSNELYNDYLEFEPESLTMNVDINIKELFNVKTILLDVVRCVEIDDNNRLILTSKKRYEKDKVRVVIPQSVEDGYELIIKEKGNIINHKKGDIIIKINVINDSGFVRKGLDLIYTKKISLKEALCGFSFDLLHINNKSYKINNTNNIIGPDYEKKIKGLGLVKGDVKGDLILRFDIVFPVSLSIQELNTIKNMNL